MFYIVGQYRTSPSYFVCTIHQPDENRGVHLLGHIWGQKIIKTKIKWRHFPSSYIINQVPAVAYLSVTVTYTKRTDYFVLHIPKTIDFLRRENFPSLLIFVLCALDSTAGIGENPVLFHGITPRRTILDHYELARAPQRLRGCSVVSLSYIRNPNPKIEIPHSYAEGSLIHFGTPDREPRLHRRLVELAKAPRRDRGGAVGTTSGHNSPNNDRSWGIHSHLTLDVS